MEKIKMIYSGRWSRGYILGDVFIKELVHYEPFALKREIVASLAAFNAGIKTPKYLDHYDDGRYMGILFQRLPMAVLSQTDVACHFRELLDIIQSFQNVPWNSEDQYWHHQMLPDFADALSFLGKDEKAIFGHISKLKPEIFVHGDFTIQNLGKCESSIYVYDFQHGCLGPRIWDLCYLVGSLDPSISRNWGLSCLEIRTAWSIAGIRLGRAIRKKAIDITERSQIFDSWSAIVK